MPITLIGAFVQTSLRTMRLMNMVKSQLEANKELVRRFVEAINKKDFIKFDELCAPNYIWHGEGGAPTIREPVRGLENFKKAVADFTNALPDLKVMIEDLVAEGDRVAVRYKEIGTHTGAPFAGIPRLGLRPPLYGQRLNSAASRV